MINTTLGRVFAIGTVSFLVMGMFFERALAAEPMPPVEQLVMQTRIERTAHREILPEKSKSIICDFRNTRGNRALCEAFLSHRDKYPADAAYCNTENCEY